MFLVNKNLEENRRLAVLGSFLSRNLYQNETFLLFSFAVEIKPQLIPLILYKKLQINSNRWEVSLCLYQFSLECIETENQTHYNYEITASSPLRNLSCCFSLWLQGSNLLLKFYATCCQV